VAEGEVVVGPCPGSEIRGAPAVPAADRRRLPGLVPRADDVTERLPGTVDFVPGFGVEVGAGGALWTRRILCVALPTVEDRSSSLDLESVRRLPVELGDSLRPVLTRRVSRRCPENAVRAFPAHDPLSNQPVESAPRECRRLGRRRVEVDDGLKVIAHGPD